MRALLKPQVPCTPPPGFIALTGVNNRAVHVNLDRLCAYSSDAAQEDKCTWLALSGYSDLIFVLEDVSAIALLIEQEVKRRA